MGFLQKLFGPPDVEALRGKGDVKGLIAALAHGPDRAVRCAAAQALGSLGDARAVHPLISAILTDPEIVVWEAASEALGWICAPEAVEPLAEALASAHSARSARCVNMVREGAARALGRTGDARALQPLIRALADPELRQTAARALGWLCERSRDPVVCSGAAEALLPLLDSGDVRDTVLQALAETRDERAIAPMVDALRHIHWAVNDASAIAAVASFGRQAVQPLAALLADSDSEVRRRAVKALAQIGDPDAVEPLLDVLEQEDAAVRWEAAQGLAALYHSDVLDARARQLILAARTSVEISRHTDREWREKPHCIPSVHTDETARIEL
jgi:HEAT repeat protein